jgi:hypothetical protein
MLITLIRPQSRTAAPLRIGVSDDQAEGVISVMATGGWHVLSKYYGPALPIFEGLRVAPLQVSTLLPTAPMRVAVEAGRRGPRAHTSASGPRVMVGT